MTQPDFTPSCEDVLDAYAVEPDHSRATLEKYLRDYPQYAAELVDLSRELARDAPVNTAPLSAEDRNMIESAWRRHLGGVSHFQVDPFETLSVTDLRAIAKQLGVPRQVLAAFRERKVVVSSIPRRFLEGLAAAMNTHVEAVLNTLSLPPALESARSFKADAKPQSDPQVAFERLLTDAGVTDDQRTRLMAD
jgi:hypothetical protein